MKRFKDFKKKSKPPIVIKAMPVHGSHSSPKKERKSNIKEDSDVPKSKYHTWVNANDNSDLTGPPKMDVDHNNVLHDKLESHYSDGWHSHPHSHKAYSYSVNSETTNKHLINLTHDHKKSDFRYGMKNWLSDGSKHIHTKEFKRFKEHVRGLDQAIKHKPLEHDLHVYHGTGNWHPGKESAKHPEGHIMIPTYLSTSISKHIAKDYSHQGNPDEHGRHVIHIHAKKGQHGIYMGNRSQYASEKEFLMPRKTVLKIHPTPDKMYNDSGTLHVWHAHVVE